MENLGLTYEVLSRSKPDLIMVSMPAFGMSGPYKYYQGLGNNVESVCGLTWLRTYPDGDLTETSATLHMDAVSGASAAFAIMAALHYRRRTGKGQFIDFARAENLMQSIGESLMDYSSMAGPDKPGQSPSLHSSAWLLSLPGERSLGHHRHRHRHGMGTAFVRPWGIRPGPANNASPTGPAGIGTRRSWTRRSPPGHSCTMRGRSWRSCNKLASLRAR